MGDLKVLVNNAGILIRAPFGQGKPLEDWDATLRVNLSGLLHDAGLCRPSERTRVAC